VKQQGDAGFGMIEIVVSMFMLALLAIAALPLLITSLQSMQRNAVLAAATQLAADGLARAENVGLTTCAAIEPLETAFPAFAHATASATSYGLTVTFDQLTACPADPVDYPTTVPVTVTVSGSAGVIASASQLVYAGAP
jgi:type II secretory pathway pseudopilin PulG